MDEALLQKFFEIHFLAIVEQVEVAHIDHLVNNPVSPFKAAQFGQAHDEGGLPAFKTGADVSAFAGALTFAAAAAEGTATGGITTAQAFFSPDGAFFGFKLMKHIIEIYS